MTLRRWRNACMVAMVVVILWSPLAVKAFGGATGWPWWIAATFPLWPAGIYLTLALPSLVMHRVRN